MRNLTRILALVLCAVMCFALCACGDKITEAIPANGEHSYENGACSVCGEADPSIGTRASDDYINIGQWLMPRNQFSGFRTIELQLRNGVQMPPPADNFRREQLGLPEKVGHHKKILHKNAARREAGRHDF